VSGASLCDLGANHQCIVNQRVSSSFCAISQQFSLHDNATVLIRCHTARGQAVIAVKSGLRPAASAMTALTAMTAMSAMTAMTAMTALTAMTAMSALTAPKELQS
jgi:hypothetical protein